MNITYDFASRKHDNMIPQYRATFMCTFKNTAQCTAMMKSYILTDNRVFINYNRSIMAKFYPPITLVPIGSSMPK